MGRATISTGNIHLAAGRSERRESDTRPVVLLGDFSGNSSRGVEVEARLLTVSRDNIDDVFARLQVQLHLPLAAEPLPFAEPDELHPDALYQRFSLFADLRQMRQRLQNNDSFAAAAAELGFAGDGSVSSDGAVSLEQLLTAADADRASTGDQTDVQTLIRQIVTPHIQPAPGPQQAILLDAIDTSISELMRALLWSRDFRALEASWLGLQWLLRRLDPERPLLLCDCNRAQLPELLASGGKLERLLGNSPAAGTPPRLLLADFRLDAQIPDIEVAKALAGFAQRHDTIALTGAAETLAGCATFAEEPDPDDWTMPLQQDVGEQWQALRESTAATHLAMVTPRWLLRLPYGRRTATIDAFDFEELTASDANPDDDCLSWGNGAWLAALALCNDIEELGSLPLYQWRDNDEVQTRHSIEAVLGDRAAAALISAGLMPLRGVPGTDTVRLPHWNSCATAGE